MIILICGESDSGKSSLCKEMQEEGFAVVSASQVAREMYEYEFQAAPSRLDLARYGALILSSHRERCFVRRVESRIELNSNVLVDGLRSIMAIRRFKKKFHAHLIIVTRNASKNGLEQEELTDALQTVDFRLNKIKCSSDFEIKNNSDIKSMRCDLLKYISKMSR